MGLADDRELVQRDSPADRASRYLAGRTDLAPPAPLFGCLRLRRKQALRRRPAPSAASALRAPRDGVDEGTRTPNHRNHNPVLCR